MVIISTFTEPVDGLKHQQPCVRVVFNGKDIGKGLLYINENVLAWQNDTNPQVGFSIEYPHISLHALSRDPASYPFPCIYIMLDGHAQLPGESNNEANGSSYANGDEDSDSDAESVPDLTEVRLIPDDVESLETIFNAIRICQELNPDPNESMSDEEEYYDGEYIVGGEGDMFEDDDNMEPDSHRFNLLNLNGGCGDAPIPPDNEAFEDAD